MAFAQEAAPSFYVQQYGKSDGLAGAGGYILYREPQGLVWVGGMDGLSSWDGRRFLTYTTRDGLTENLITDIKTDSAGRLYVSAGTGISMYIGRPGMAFLPLKLPRQVLSVSAFIPQDSTSFYIADDLSRSLWYVQGGTISRIEGIQDRVYKLARDRVGTVYGLSHEGRLYVIKNKKVTATLPCPPTAEGAWAISARFAIRLSEHNGSVFLYGPMLALLSGQPPYSLPYTVPEGEDHYNFSYGSSTPGALWRRRANAWVRVASLPANMSINSDLLQSSSGDVIFINENVGMQVLIPRVYRPVPAVWPVRYHAMGAGGARVLHTDSTLYYNPTVRAAMAQAGGATGVNTVFRSRNGTVWFCARTGLFYLPGGIGPVQHFSFGKNDAVDDNYFILALEDAAGTMWFETTNGFVRYSNGAFNYWNNTTILQDRYFLSIATDRNGIFYAGSYSMYTVQLGETVNVSARLGLPRSPILAMATDTGGHLWMTTNYSRIYSIGYQAHSGYYRADSLELELNGEPYAARSLAFDSRGNMWVSSREHLVIYLQQQTGRYDAARRIVLSKGRFLENDKDERMPLITNEDRTVIYLRQTAFDAAEVIRSNAAAAPKVLLTDVRLFHRDTDWRTLADSTDPFGIPVRPVLKPKDNAITFRYTGIANDGDPAVRYTHMLKGLESDWQPLSDIAEADYTNLPAGSYTLLLKAVNISGQWSEPVEFTFRITAPWYKTPQAFILWTFLIFIAGTGVSRYRIEKVKKRARIERLLVEQQLKALRAQINPHFLQNSLEFLMQAIDKENPRTVQDLVQQLSLYLRNVLQLSDKSIITLEDELVFSEEYLAINKLLFRNRFDYSIEVNGNIDTFALKVPSMLLQPFLENAIKHGLPAGKDTGKGSIAVSIERKGQYICCSVSNTTGPLEARYHPGRGYIPKGLAITGERLMLLYPKENKKDLIYFYSENGMYTAAVCIPV